MATKKKTAISPHMRKLSEHLAGAIAKPLGEGSITLHGEPPKIRLVVGRKVTDYENSQSPNVSMEASLMK